MLKSQQLLSTNNTILTDDEIVGTINSASVYPREVVKDVLRVNAASVILAHNHPSGSVEVSTADKLITGKLIKALSLIDVEVLDHLIIGNSYASFAELNLLAQLKQEVECLDVIKLHG